MPDDDDNNSNIKDKNGNIKKRILKKIVDKAIDQNPLLYERLAEI